MKKILMHVLLVLLLCSLLMILPAVAVTNGKIAFSSDRYGNREIYVMNADGTEQTRLTTNLDRNLNPVWSPDGTQIAFESFNQEGNNEIYVMNADGTEQTRLTTGTYPDFSINPKWSPDGSKIAFDSQRDGNQDIYVMNKDGTEQIRLTTNPLWDWGRNPAWSPDGSKIAFESSRDGNIEIYVMNADGTGQTRLTTNLDWDQNPAWSPDGTQIAFKSFREGKDEIYVMNADGTEQTRLTTETLYIHSVFAHFVWSPDGSKIAFGSYRDSNNRMPSAQDIYVMNADGTEQTRLTTNPSWDLDPSWCPAVKPGSLEVKSSPSKAKIYINGIYKEQVTRWKFDDMAPGDYNVSVMLEGYSTPATETVNVISGQTASLHFKLVKVKKVK